MLRNLAGIDGYDSFDMGQPHHPIDEEIRNRLRKLAPNQTELARAIGRNQSWLNKYINGVGHATIDDVIRIAAAIVLGVERVEPNERVRRLLRLFDQIPETMQDDAIAILESYTRRARRARLPESAEPMAQTHPKAASKARGKR